MTASRHLRAVGDLEMDSVDGGAISNAVAHGTSKDVLLALRRRLAQSLDDAATPPRDLAALSRRLLEVDEQIRTIELAEQEKARQEEAETTEDEEGLGDV
ncbi:hypothetical protein NSA19_00920 [Actinomyces bowdenii]|uniref:hypothetical protein n=1 Tax=Actinomyces bowdenii TaxID=131109 RepID=UPI00214BE271|nr:hypothetical protein [Actinomyces bowdenii]MCR2051438.1 hypothetical protein [Actinomyces bowdenii]